MQEGQFWLWGVGLSVLGKTQSPGVLGGGGESQPSSWTGASDLASASEQEAQFESSRAFGVLPKPTLELVWAAFLDEQILEQW